MRIDLQGRDRERRGAVRGWDAFHVQQMHDERALAAMRRVRDAGIAVVWDTDDDISAITRGSQAWNRIGDRRNIRRSFERAIAAARTSAPRDPAQSRLRRFADPIEDPLARVIAFGSVAAQLSGWLLAPIPHPPTRHPRRGGTRAQQRAAWALDVQIAACAFAGRHGVLTEKVDDFGVLRDAIAELLSGTPPLAVSDPRL